ncbi:hypothetical protein PybrP1_003263 [[Pythium] brassicae (nom. inval.)]|nr:hypothetical protein PybrP1_003263 [[Pythium] brassicae (nom. inval.)]
MLLQPLANPTIAHGHPMHHRSLALRSLCEPSADVVPRVYSKNAMMATLELYFRPLPTQRTSVGVHSSSSSFVSATAAALLPQLQVCQLSGSLDERTPDYTIKRSLADLKKLRVDVTLCVGKGDHCNLCGTIAAYMVHCWERPRLLNRAWNGVMSFQLDVLGKFLNTLLHFASQARADGSEPVECHAKFASIVSVFLQPDADKDL